MRDIIFRAYDKVRKEYLSGGQILISIEPGRRPEKSNFYLDILKAPNMYNDRFIIEQYAGLKDKNGKLIYEGDIIQIRISAGYAECYEMEKFTVEYKCGNQLGRFIAVDINGESWNIDNNNSNEILAIGNIHENPELLKKED